MKQSYKKLTKKIIKKIELIGRFKNVTSNFRFVMIYIIHKILVLLRNLNLEFSKCSILECFLKSIIDF